MKIGAHISIGKSIDLAIDRAVKIGCDTFQIFTKSPRAWHFNALSEEKILKFTSKIDKFSISPIFAHATYLINLANPNEENLKKSFFLLKEELKRCDQLKIPFLVTHFCYSRTLKEPFITEKITTNLNNLFKNYQGNSKLLLENTVGKRDSIGSNIYKIGKIISQLEFYNNVGLCLDTCHAFSSGYNFKEVTDIDELISEIEQTIGIKKVHCIHCNDSKFNIGEGIDRHEHIGLGKIGEEGFSNLLLNKEIRKIPFICETPIDERRSDKENILCLRELEKKVLI